MIKFLASADANRIVITFSRPIRNENLLNAFNIAGLPANTGLDATLDKGGEVVHLALKSLPLQEPATSPTFGVGGYRLMVSGTSTPPTQIVRAQDDGSPLDGNGDNRPGDNFLLDINVTSTPTRPPGGKPRPELD